MSDLDVTPTLDTLSRVVAEETAQLGQVADQLEQARLAYRQKQTKLIGSLHERVRPFMLAWAKVAPQLGDGVNTIVLGPWFSIHGRVWIDAKGDLVMTDNATVAPPVGGGGKIVTPEQVVAEIGEVDPAPIVSNLTKQVQHVRKLLAEHVSRLQGYVDEAVKNTQPVTDEPPAESF